MKLWNWLNGKKTMTAAWFGCAYGIALAINGIYPIQPVIDILHALAPAFGGLAALGVAHKIQKK